MDVDHPGKDSCVPRRDNFLYLKPTPKELSTGDESFMSTTAYCAPNTVLGIENTTVKTDNKVQTRTDIPVEEENRIV